ncbi:MAG: DUF2156 domain-containing protein [Negativicutes bacterium]|nr:DUF2156 domain-containing protein [Negativicutes bacterium]
MKNYQGSECTFTNLFIWRKCYGICWTISHDCLIVKVTRKDTTFVLPPFGANEENWPKVLEESKEIFAGNPVEIRGIYEENLPVLQSILPQTASIVEDRDNWDYVYLREGLASLAGRKYHSKKNHANAFRKEHPDYEFKIITKDDVPECIAFADLWCEMKGQNAEGLRCEFCALEQALNNCETLNIRAALIRVDGEIQAFTIGEKINHDMAVIHFEKANPNIRGLYAVINQDFCAKVWSDVTYINREEDMGIEGLRKAKESYQPVFMVKKYTAIISD